MQPVPNQAIHQHPSQRQRVEPMESTIRTEQPIRTVANIHMVFQVQQVAQAFRADTLDTAAMPVAPPMVTAMAATHALCITPVIKHGLSASMADNPFAFRTFKFIATHKKLS